MGVFTKNETETAALASQLASHLQTGDVLLLQGPLGAGKSVFARALLQALSDDPDLEVPSPTFTLVQTYDTTKGPVWHFDLYRLKDPDEIYEIGWEEALSEGILIVEWPERLGPLKPKRHITVEIKTAPDGRHVEIHRHET